MSYSTNVSYIQIPIKFDFVKVEQIQSNRWILYSKPPTEIIRACDNEILRYTVQGTYLITLDDHCQVNIGDYHLQRHLTIESNMQYTKLPLVNLPGNLTVASMKEGEPVNLDDIDLANLQMLAYVLKKSLSVPSIAAVTASMDNKCYRYNIQLSIQTPKKEVIVEFEDMMVEHLTVYRRFQQNTLPKKIFVFRDGVSEGQFAEVMNSELVAVHRAYERLAGPTGGKPEVLFLLVQKRHHTRLFSGPNNPRNVEPGTVVDTHIVHARELDFYLVSHQAIKGTARPTRYHAVCNDGQIPHDEVEQLTFYLCHVYSRCMRSVSYPTPTYYAHLACLRARSLTYGQKFDIAQLEKQPQRLKVLDKMLLTSRMFFV